MNFEVVKADIVNVSADAVVLPANRWLREGRGASEAIFRAAGRTQLKEACKNLAPCEVGNAVPTEAFHLNAKYIIHAVVPKWIDGDHNEYALLSSAYLSSLNIANIMGCREIAFPLLASGNNGFDTKLAFQIAAESLKDFQGNTLQKAYLVLYGYGISAYAQSQGYHVLTIPDQAMGKEKRGYRNKSLFEKLAEDPLVREGVKTGIRWMESPNNQKKMIDAGKKIFAAILH